MRWWGQATDVKATCTVERWRGDCGGRGRTVTVTLRPLCCDSTTSFDRAVGAGPPGRQRDAKRSRDRGTQFWPATDAEGERHARQPLRRVHRRTARAGDEHAPVSRWFKPSHGRPDPRRHLGHGSVEHHAGGELPPSAQVLFQCGHRVEAVGRLELVRGPRDRSDPVDPTGPDRVRAMGMTQEVPPPVADDHCPGVHLGLPLVAGLAATRHQHAMSGRDGSDECAGGGGIWTGRGPVGRS